MALIVVAARWAHSIGERYDDYCVELCGQREKRMGKQQDEEEEGH